MLTKATLPQIAPTNHVPQDKYSLNLWRWARKAIGKGIPVTVAIATNEGEKYDPTKTQASSIYIGYGSGKEILADGWLHGSRLTEILCNGTKASSWAHPPRMRFEIIPDWWERYIAGGKCFIDPEHRLYGPERWKVSEDGQERTCIWCGIHKQYLHTEMVSKTEWRDTATSAGKDASEVYHEYKKLGYFKAFGFDEYDMDLSGVSDTDQLALFEFIRHRVMTKTGETAK